MLNIFIYGISNVGSENQSRLLDLGSDGRELKHEDQLI